ncbi:hypothetical protein ACFU8W_48490 [Streptomyces sp. NPDC057565]|uniref:hypothetical protein n=1 Tax=Streptomyces sp. NPDC057565 TaxID=3346169 RepID=UPI00369CA130
MNTTTRYKVHISGDGQLHIDAERQVVPDGVDPSQVVQQVLHIEAAGTNRPVLAQVQDDRSNARFDIQVMPDGTTRPLDQPPMPQTPTATPNADFAQRLAAAQAAGRAHDLATAIPATVDLLLETAAELGDTARETLEVAQFRADLAYLSGDYAFATASWTWLALAWFDRLGPGKRRTQVAAQCATAAWMQLPPHEAVRTSSEVVSMLLEVTGPERTQTMRAAIEARIKGGNP